jgi:hypothetical protein
MHDEEAIYQYGPALFAIFVLTTPHAPCMVIHLVYDLVVNVLLFRCGNGDAGVLPVTKPVRCMAELVTTTTGTPKVVLI